MYILKNSVKNLCRNKGRNIIIGIIILVMLTFTAISMTINSATDSVIRKYKAQFGSEIYLQYDETKINEEGKNGEWAVIPEISDEIKIKISDSKYLKETMISVQYSAFAKDLNGFDYGKQQSTSGNISTAPSGNDSYFEPNLTVYGYNTPELLKDFKEGKRKIITGRMFENNNECVISKDFANLNNLNIGDTISAGNCEKNSKIEPLQLNITGIFFDSTENKYGYISAATNPRNDILTTYDTMRNYQDEIAKIKLYSVNTTYYLIEPDLLMAFDKEAHEKGLHKNYKMATDSISYDKIVKPAEGLAKVSRTFLIAVLIIGSIILILLSILAIRERKYEIGVLRAMGMKKIKVVRAILYESLIIIGVCLVIGLSIGSISAQPISDSIAANQQISSSNQNFGNAAQGATEKISVMLTPDAILKISVVAIILVFMSSGVGALYILRYEPMKILSERN